MKIVHIYKSQAVSVEPETQSVTIILDTPIPDQVTSQKESEWRPIYTGLFSEEAEMLEKTLRNVLPGGTYDALFACMAKRTASLFFMPHK